MQNENRVGNEWFELIKGAALALGTALITTVIFAWILRYAPISEKWIYPINQTIKILSIAVGTLVCVRGEKGFLKGGAIALLFTALSYLTFSALGGNFALGWVVLVEVVLAIFAGVIFGAIAVNFRRN